MVRIKRWSDGLRGGLLALAAMAGICGATPAPLAAQPADHFGGWKEEQARDDRWKLTNIGPFLACTLNVPGQGMTMKALVIRIGDQEEAAVAYDTELLRMSAGWAGPFLRFDATRYGIIVPPVAGGAVKFRTSAMPGWRPRTGAGENGDPRKPARGPLPRAFARYQGLHLNGKRVALALKVDGREILESPWMEKGEGVAAFSRNLAIGRGEKPVQMVICDEAKGAAAMEAGGGRPLALIKSADGQMVTAVALIDPSGKGALRAAGSRIEATMEAHDQPLAMKVLIWSGKVADAAGLAGFRKLVEGSAAPEDVMRFTQPGVKLWPQAITTQGNIGREEGAFAVDTLTLPYENPYKALMFVSGHDFFSDKSVALCTLHGDVWLVDGIDEKLEKLTFVRFATGLFQPLGLKIIGDKVYVTGRDQITILHDRNGDGQADFYENFNNEGQVSANGHEYVTNLETDSKGNFYYLKGDSNSATAHDGALLRVSADGAGLAVHATGMRNANSMAIGPGDLISVSPQEGNWTPTSRIDLVRPGGFYGNMPSHHRPTPPAGYDPPLLWLPRKYDNSSGAQVFVSSGKWGPLKDQLLHFSYGRCNMLLTLRQKVGAEGAIYNGAFIQLPARFLAGPVRARFSPHDGQLYVSGLNGWVTAAIRDGSFQRVRYTGRAVDLPIGFAARRGRLELTFTQPLDGKVSADPKRFALTQWNYRWSGEYGSKEWSVADPKKEGADAVVIQKVELSEDGRTLTLHIADLKPVHQMRLQFNLQTAAGTRLRDELHLTLNELAN